MINPGDFARFCEVELVNEHGQPVRVLPWWLDVVAGLRDRLEVLVCTIRQQGKSLLAGCLANYCLFHLRDAYLLFVASSERQAKSILAQKLKKPIESNPRLRRDARILDNRISVPELGTVLEIVAASEATSPGRTVNLLILDEAREIEDPLYLRLKPSTLACEGRTLVTSTPGPPRGFFYELVSNPGPDMHVFRSTDIINPFTSKRHIREAAGLAHLFPGLYDREYLGRFADLGDEFITRDRLNLVVDGALENRSGSKLPCFGFLDLSRKRDLTSLIVVERGAASGLAGSGPHSGAISAKLRGSGEDLLTVVLIRTWDPRTFPSRELDFGVIRAALTDVFERFKVEGLGIDDRAEAGELLAWTRRQRWGNAVRPVAQTTQLNMALWGRLAERINAATIRIPRHRRLIDELLSLRVEDMAAGRSWRVVDSQRKLHRDVSMTLAGAVWIAGEVTEPAFLTYLRGQVEEMRRKDARKLQCPRREQQGASA